MVYNSITSINKFHHRLSCSSQFLIQIDASRHFFSLKREKRATRAKMMPHFDLYEHFARNIIIRMFISKFEIKF